MLLLCNKIMLNMLNLSKIDFNKIIQRLYNFYSRNYCGTIANMSVQCRGCLRPSLVCVICLLPIKGMASCCALCGHPGHFKHVKRWFSKQEQCPVPGCECYCNAK